MAARKGGERRGAARASLADGEGAARDSCPNETAGKKTWTCARSPADVRACCGRGASDCIRHSKKDGDERIQGSKPHRTARASRQGPTGNSREIPVAPGAG